MDAPQRLELLTDLPPLPPFAVPEPDQPLPGEPPADEPTATADGVELAESLVGLADAAIGWIAYGADNSRPVAPPPAQRRVAEAMVRVAGHLGPAAGAARIVIPEPVADGLALVGWSAVAWGGALMLGISRWRQRRAEDRQADTGGGAAGGDDRGGAGGAAGGIAARGRRAARAAPVPAGGDQLDTDYESRLLAAVARPGGTSPRR